MLKLRGYYTRFRKSVLSTLLQNSTKRAVEDISVLYLFTFLDRMPIIPSTADDSVLRAVPNQTVHVEWEIHKFVNRTYEKLEHFESPSFLFHGVTWCIQLYPRYNGNVDVDLYKKISPKELLFSVAIRMKKGKESEFKSSYTSGLFKNDEYRLTALSFPSSELFHSLDLVAPNGILTIFLTLWTHDGSPENVAVEAACQTPSNDEDPLSEQYKDLFLTECEADTTVNVKGKEFKVHKSVLVARSSVFRAMFQADMAEKNSSNIDIEDCEPEIFHAFLLHLYSGKLDVISSSNAIGLYLLADRYNFKKLKERCLQSLFHEITVDSVCDIVHFASLHDEHELLEASTEFFLNNSDAILKTAKWFSFLTENLVVANELFVKMSMKMKNLS